MENTGNTTLHFLEIFNSGTDKSSLHRMQCGATDGDFVADRVQDVSLSQWLALTPPELVKAHLGISDETIQHLNKIKPVVVAPYTPAQN